MTQTRCVRLNGQDDLTIAATDLPAPDRGQVRVAVLAGGICGSDLHYWQEGGIGTIRVREPIILATRLPAGSGPWAPTSPTCGWASWSR